MHAEGKHPRMYRVEDGYMVGQLPPPYSVLSQILLPKNATSSHCTASTTLPSIDIAQGCRKYTMLSLRVGLLKRPSDAIKVSSTEAL